MATVIKTGFWQTATGKTLVVIGYQSVALAITIGQQELVSNPDFLGKWTPLAVFILSNLAAVIIAKFGDPKLKNI